MLIYRIVLLLYIRQLFRLMGILGYIRGRKFFDELSVGDGLEYPVKKRKNAISPSKTAAMAFGHGKAFREAAVFFNSFSEALKNSARTRTILHGSRKYKGIPSVFPELYNTVEVMNNAE